MENLDMFPTERTEDWTPLERPSEYDIAHAFPFITHLPIAGGTRIRYLGIPSRPTVLANFHYTLDNLSTMHPEVTPWHLVDKRLRKNPQRAKKGKREDVTLSFRWGNTFLTKKAFTFGLRHVEPGTVHIYQTLQAPMLIYMPKGGFQQQQRERTFDYIHEYSFIPYLMPPHTVTALKSTYLLLTTGKTIFSIHIGYPQLLQQIQELYGFQIVNLQPWVSQKKAIIIPSGGEASVIPVEQVWKRRKIHDPMRKTEVPTLEENSDIFTWEVNSDNLTLEENSDDFTWNTLDVPTLEEISDALDVPTLEENFNDPSNYLDEWLQITSKFEYTEITLYDIDWE